MWPVVYGPNWAWSVLVALPLAGLLISVIVFVRLLITAKTTPPDKGNPWDNF